MGQRGRHRVETDFNFQDLVGKLAELYKFANS
jgi:hypothetical protein